MTADPDYATKYFGNEKTKKKGQLMQMNQNLEFWNKMEIYKSIVILILWMFEKI